MDYKEYLLNLSSGNIAPLTKMQGSNYVNMDTNINALLNLTLNSVIAPRYRVFIVNNDDTIQSEIPLNDIIQGGTFNENYQNGQRCSLSLTVFNQTGEYTPNINKLWVGTKLRLDAGLEQQDGSIIWCQKGIFVITSTQPSYSSDNKTVSISAGDKFAELEGGVGILQDTFEIPAGSRILSVTRELLATQRGDGTPIDAQEPYFHPDLAQKVTQAKISKNAGESIGSIILELANHMSAEVFYNAQGRLCFLPINTVSDDNDKPILFNYITDKGHLSDLNFSLDYNNIINRIILIGATVNGGVVRATASNDDVSSPLCVQRIGARTSVINESGIKTKIVAEENAKYNLRKQLILKSSVNLTTPYNPLFGVNNLVMVTDDFYHLIKQYFLIQSVSFNLDYNSSMSLTVSNLNNLPFITNYRSSSEEDMEQYEFNTLTSYGVTITANNGTVIGANKIYANGELTLYIQPNEGYSMPPSITVAGCNYKYYPTSGKIVLRNPIGPVAVNVNCSGVYTFAITKGEHITSIVYNISGTTYPSVEEVSLQLVSGTSYSWYAIPAEGYSTEYNESRPCTGILTQDVSYTAVADAITYPVTFSMGDYVLDAFTSKESNATSGNESGHEYGYDSEVFYYVQKYADTDQYKYECSGVQIGSSDIYKLGSVTIDGPINLGVLSNTTRSIQNYPVTFTLGNYVTYAFTSDHSDGDTRYRHESGYEYAYGTTVYYFVEKYAGDNDYVYDCNGTLISGNIYRLGSITIDGHNNNLGALSNVTRIAIYPVTITAGTDITSVYLSTNPSATSGDISGTKYRDGSTVYGFVTIRANDTEYTYKPQDNWILIDENTRKYRINSVYVDSAKTFGTVSAKREINKYSVSITGGIGINSVYLSETDNDTSGDASPHSYEYGTHVYAYVVLKNNTAQYTYSIPPQSGWVLVPGTSRNYKVGDILLTSGNYDFGTKNAIETINQYQVTITAGTDVISVYMSTEPEAESGDTSPHSYDYGTTVYGFAVVPQNDETYTYIIPSDWELVDSGNNRIYRVGSVEATTTQDFGTKSITKEYVPYTVTITAGQGVASVYMSTNPNARIGDTSPHTYNYNTTVYGFAILKTDTESIGYRPQAGWQLVEGTTKTYRLTNPVVTTTDQSFGTVDAIVVTTYPVSITAGVGIDMVYLSTNRTATSGDPSGTKYDYNSIVYGFVKIANDTAHYSYLPQDGWTQLQGAGNSKLYRVGEVRVTSAQDFGTLDAIVNVNQYAVTITAGEGIASVYLSTNPAAESGNPSGTVYNYDTTVYGFATLADNTAQYRYDPQSDWILVSGRTYRMKDYVVTTSAQTFGTIDASVGLRSYPVTFTLGDYVTTGFVSTNPEATSGSGSGEVAYGYGTTVYYFVEKYIDTVEYTYTCSGTRIGNTNIYRLGSITIDGTNGNLGEISDVTRTPNNFTLTVNVPEVGIAETWYRIGSTGSYTKITFSGSAVEIPVPYDSYVYIYDVPITGYTANYTQSNPLQFKMGTSGYTYSPVPKTSTLTLTKNTGIASIYYKINGATTWIETTSSTTVNVNYNTNVYWYATASTGYSRDDSYVDPSHYATVPNVKRNYEISPTATRLTYSFTITLSDYVTEFKYSTDGTHWSSGISTSRTFSNVDYATTYYVKPTAYGVSDAEWTYTWVQGSDATTLITYSSHDNIIYQQSRTKNSYAVTITGGNGIQSVYLSTDPIATSGDPSGTLYPYNTENEVYAFVSILNDSVQYTYRPLDGWVRITSTPYRTYRIGSTTVTSSYNFGTIDAEVTEKTYEVTITKGNGIAGVYLSTNQTAESGDPSGTGYPYNTPVYGFAVIAPPTPQYTYSAPYNWTLISGKTYRLNNSVITKSNQDFGTINAVSATRSYPVTFTMGPYITRAFVSTSDNVTSGSASGTVYEYGTTVYYYVEKYVDTVEYTYTCNGTRIGTSNVYRLGSITIDGTNGNLGEISNVTQTPNNFTLTVNVPEVGIAETWYRIGSTGSYTKITFSSEAFTAQVPYGSRVYIYDVPLAGYTVNYSSESPLTFTMGTSGYTYSPKPKTSTLTLTKNTGVSAIYYKVNGASEWAQTATSITVEVNYNTNVYWYAPAANGYSRDDSYIDSSHYATVPNVKRNYEVSPTATRLTYSFTVTLSDYVTEFSYSLNGTTWTPSASTKTFNNVDFNTRYYIKPTVYGVDDDQWIYTWEQGSTDTITITYSSHSDITYQQSRELNSHTVTIIPGTGIESVYLSTEPTATSGSPSGSSYTYNTVVYGFVALKDDTSEVSYLPQEGWSPIIGANRTYRVGYVRTTTDQNFGTVDAISSIPKYTLTINLPEIGILETWYKIGSGSYTKVTYGSEAFTIQVEKGTTVLLYDVPVTGYTVNYSSENPLSFEMSSSGYTYSPIPKTVPVEIIKNTGVASIYYKINGAATWTQTTSSTVLDVNYNTNVYWYAPASTGYSRNDSYVDSSHYATISNVKTSKEISPTATRLTYSFTVTLSDYVTEFSYSLNGTTWTPSASTKTFNNVDFNTRYYIKPTVYGETDAEWTYSWVQGSADTTTITYSSHSDITYKQSRTKNSYSVTIGKGLGISSVYLSTNSTATSGDASGTNYEYNTVVYGFATLLNNTAQYTYEPLDGWVKLVGSDRTYRIGYVTTTSAQSFGTVNAEVITNKYAVTITAGTGIDSVYLSTHDGAMSGDPSGTTYNYRTRVYGYATISEPTAQYTYSAPVGWTLVSGTTRTYKIGEVVVDEAEDFGTANAISATNKYAVTFSLGDYVTNAFTSTTINATSGKASGTQYEYGVRVYYFVTKFANTTEYSYNCSGTQVSGNIYRLGYIDVDGTNGNLGALSSVTQVPNNFTLTINLPAIGISQTWYKVGSGSYTKVTYGSEAFTVQVPYNSSVSIYDIPISGYTVRYTNTDPLTFTMGTSGYTYSPVPATSTLTIEKNTGVASIWYKKNGESNFIQTTVSRDIAINYNTNVYWYAPGETGYSRDDSYISESTCATISGMKTSRTISPTATRMTYSFTVTLSDYVTQFSYSTDNIHWATVNSSRTFSDIDYDITYYIKPTVYGETDAEWTYTWVQGSADITVMTYSSHDNITYKQSRTKNSYAVTITGGTGIDSVYLSSTSSTATSGDPSGTLYEYGTTVYGFVEIKANTAQYTYEPQDDWVQLAGAGNSRKYRVGEVSVDSVQSFGTKNAKVTTNKYAVSITGGTGIASVYLSTHDGAMSGDTSPHSYNYNTKVYAYVTLADDTSEYSYAPQDDWTLVSGTTKSYKVGEVVVKTTYNFGIKDAKVTDIRPTVTITAGAGVQSVYLSTSSTATSGDPSGTRYPVGTVVYGFVILKNNTAQYAYSPQSGWSLLAGTSRTYRVGYVTTTSDKDFGTQDAIVTLRSYAVTFSLGNYVTSAFTSTNINATSGNPSETTYDYGTRVYYFVTKYADSTEYTYTCSGTLVSGNVYRLGYIDVDGTNGSLGTLSSVTRTPNNFNLIVNMGSTGVTAVYVKIGTGSYVRYPNPDEALFISVPYDTTFQIYDEVAAGYTARYTESVPFVYTMTTAGYTYNTSPATWSISFVKNTGVSAIYYREINSSNWTSITSSQTVSFTYSSASRVYWYAPAATGYTRDDSYVDSSHYATVYNPTTVSPTATINKYAVNFTLGSYVTRAFTSTNRTAISGNPSGTTYDYGTTVYYFVEKYEDTEEYTYTCSGTRVSGNVYRLGSVLVTSTKNLGALSGVTRTETRVTYTVHIACINNSVISPYYICSDVNDYNDMISQGGLGHWLIVEDTTGISRPASSTEVIVSQSIINDICSPYGYSYTGGPVTVTVSPSNLDIYIGAYVVEDDH